MVNTPFRTSAGGGGTSGISGGARCCYSVSREDCLRVVTDLSGLHLAFLKEGFSQFLLNPLSLTPSKLPRFSANRMPASGCLHYCHPHHLAFYGFLPFPAERQARHEVFCEPPRCSSLRAPAVSVQLVAACMDEFKVRVITWFKSRLLYS